MVYSHLKTLKSTYVFAKPHTKDMFKTNVFAFRLSTLLLQGKSRLTLSSTSTVLT